MSEQAQGNNQQVIVYVLIAIAVLLAVIVGFMIYNNATNVPAPTASSTTAPSAADSAAQNAASNMPAPAPEVKFDPKTATKVPAGMTPEQALKTYNEDIMKKKYAEAYALLPLAQKTSYGSADAYGQQVGQYGITGYKLGTPQTSGTDVTISSEQQTPQMNISYTWTYTKVDGAWYVKSRVMGAAGQ